MGEIITTGKSLESILEKWSSEWACPKEQIRLEVLEKPGVINRNWKVKLILDKECKERYNSQRIQITWDGEKYKIIPNSVMESIVPFPRAGKLFHQRQEIKEEYSVHKGDVFEFYPEVKKGGLSWTIQVEPAGSKALAKVKNEHSGSYVFIEDIPSVTRFLLEKYMAWQPTVHSREMPTEKDLQKELSDKGIIFGIKPNIWVDILSTNGEKEIIIAEHKAPLETIQPELLDYVGEGALEAQPEIGLDEQEETIDFFACKLRLCEKDEVLARIVPGKEGIGGINIYGQVIPAKPLKKIEIKLKKNVYLSEDGLEVKASCSGTPLRVNQYTYSVENILIINKDLDIETGKITFKGDVKIGRDIKDSLAVHSEGMVTVHGSVSGAEIKAETGLVVKQNVIASKIIVGERHVFRSEFVKVLQEVSEDLGICLTQVGQLQEASQNENTGQLLKLLLERSFTLLPKKAEELENLLGYADPDFVSQELEIAVKTMKHFLVGRGPLQLRELTHLQSALKITGHFLATKGERIPTSVVCDTGYVQNSEISCAGDFLCKRGVYNSMIRAEGDVKIIGVCRGGEINCSGNIYIGELGGSCMSATVIKAAKNSRIAIDYSHPNVKIYVGKELVRIDEKVQKLDIYREKAILQVEKLKWDGRN